MLVQQDPRQHAVGHQRTRAVAAGKAQATGHGVALQMLRPHAAHPLLEAGIQQRVAGNGPDPADGHGPFSAPDPEQGTRDAGGCQHGRIGQMAHAAKQVEQGRMHMQAERMRQSGVESGHRAVVHHLPGQHAPERRGEEHPRSSRVAEWRVKGATDGTVALHVAAQGQGDGHHRQQPQHENSARCLSPMLRHGSPESAVRGQCVGAGRYRNAAHRSQVVATQAKACRLASKSQRSTCHCGVRSCSGLCRCPWGAAVAGRIRFTEFG